MKWSTSRLLGSRNKSTVIKSSIPILASNQTTIHALSEHAETNVHAEWHTAIASRLELYQYFLGNSSTSVESSLPIVRNITDTYLQRLRSGFYAADASDQQLGTLIEQHTSRHPCGREVALVSCLHVLSASAAQLHLAALRDGDVKKYVKLLVVACIVNPAVASIPEASLAQSLQPTIFQCDQDSEHIKTFRRLLEAVTRVDKWHLVTPSTVRKVLDAANFQERLQDEIQRLFKDHRYLTAFKAVAWMKSIVSAPDTTAVSQLLDHTLPMWKGLHAWEPKIQRISKLELGRLSESQRQKLRPLLSLDGPDFITQKQPYLAMVQSTHNFETPQVDSLLDLLCDCQELGPQSVELFIHLCAQSRFDDSKVTFIKDVLGEGNDALSHGITVVLSVLEGAGTMTQRLKALTQALPLVKGLGSPFLAVGPFSEACALLEVTMSQAQDAFIEALKVGSGKKLGMSVYAYGLALLEASFLHDLISAEMLTLLRQYPSRDTLETIFDRIWEASKSCAIEGCRLKSYLASTLGGRPLRLDESVTLNALQHEVSFWKQPMGTARQDLARLIEKSQCVSYSLYTSWLQVLLREDDQFVVNVKHYLTGGEQGLLRFGEYLSLRRKFGTMQDETWLRLYAALIQDRGPEYLRKTANSMPVSEWLELVSNLLKLVDSIRGHLPQFGAGLTQEQVEWWESLAQRKMAVRRIFTKQDLSSNPLWLYFPQKPAKVQRLLQLVERKDFDSTLYPSVLPYLSPDGRNLNSLCECMEALGRVSSFGEKIVRRQIARHQDKGFDKLSPDAIGTLIQQWLTNETLVGEPDRRALLLLFDLFKLPASLNTASLSSLRKYLEEQYHALIERAKILEKSRLRLHLSDPSRSATLARSLGIESTLHTRSLQGDIPEEIADAVESLGPNDYEIAFPLTSVNELQRAAKGMPLDACLLLVRVHMSNGSFHRKVYYYPMHSQPTLISFDLEMALALLLSGHVIDISMIHDTVNKLITLSSSVCLICRGDMSVRLWKPAVCSKACSVALRTAPLEIRLHNLLIDSKAIDLLLTSIYATVSESLSTTLLPGCPIPIPSLHAVIDSLPDLSRLQTTDDLRSALRGTDSLAKDREALLSWLCLRFRGLILSAPSSFKIPSLGLNTHQFLVVDSCPEREKAFRRHLVPSLSPSSAPSTVVFHGTRASRLFPILCQGLVVASNSALSINGAAYGAGVYCGHDMSPSWGFSGSTAQSWRNSSLGNLRVMLGCELAPASGPTHGGVHVVTDESRLLVRYVFLLPEGFAPPVRAHVEPAMMTGIARLRAGVQG
ncbi:hypothetical protein EJ04DRAFT_574375 [Polyplosphaeria fusca]|uniref:PARP catalytic domain-containing protein n=1 Tax=Polyplosphaeria fusca TaxID=682080 RepID=A0A9P4R6G5_9PLEO|nr:hypothetical protein EJ04DRAFT_574375 [Polyplosphaeria fusca]